MEVANRLTSALEELFEEDLDRFRWTLHEFPVRQGYENIPWGCLENASILQVVDLLLDFYTEGYAPRVTVEVLEAIGCKQQAQRLRVALESGRAKRKKGSGVAMGRAVHPGLPRVEPWSGELGTGSLLPTAYACMIWVGLDPPSGWRWKSAGEPLLSPCPSHSTYI